MSTPIPGPAGWPFLGNMTDIDPELPIKSLTDIADKYGPHHNWIHNSNELT
jgi:cytochrome P450/NADPH-cytochrome P450 reductase